MVSQRDWRWSADLPVIGPIRETIPTERRLQATVWVWNSSFATTGSARPIRRSGQRRRSWFIWSMESRKACWCWGEPLSSNNPPGKPKNVFKECCVLRVAVDFPITLENFDNFPRQFDESVTSEQTAP